MKALVFEGPGSKHWQDVADARIVDEGDALVQIDATTICGTDLHILNGDVPEVAAGRTLGHEGVGTVLEVGRGVQRVKVGDRVLVSCISSCGRCPSCRDGHAGQCVGGGGWVLGHLIDGTQAEVVRVPFADLSTFPTPAGVPDESVLMLSDILPTGYEVGVLNGRARPGDVIAVVGAGPIGLAAIAGARLYSPSCIVAIDIADARLDKARAMGADVCVNSTTSDAVDVVMGLTGRLGAYVAMEAVGVPEAFELAVDLVRPGGHVANIGVHGRPATLHLERIWIRNLTITTGLVDTFSTPTLLDLIAHGRIDPSGLVTHRFSLDEFETAYDVFSRPGETGALKVAILRNA